MSHQHPDETQARAALDRIAEHVQARLAGRVRDFRIVQREHGVVLCGQARTYHAKQLAQHAFMEAAVLPVLANEILVS